MMKPSPSAAARKLAIFFVGPKVLQNLLLWPRLGIPALGSNIKWLHGDTEPGCPLSRPPCHYRAAAAAAAASAPRVYS